MTIQAQSKCKPGSWQQSDSAVWILTTISGCFSQNISLLLSMSKADQWLLPESRVDLFPLSKCQWN